MDYPEAILLKSSKLLAEVKKSHRKRISSQYLPKYVSEYLSWKKKCCDSEGGTEEDRRIDPPLDFGIFIEIKIGSILPYIKFVLP